MFTLNTNFTFRSWVKTRFSNEI